MSIRSNIVFADNTADLKARIASTSTEIFAMKDAVERTSRALGGDGLLKAAHQTTAAVEQLGGATKLTTAEKERINKQLTTAIEKYQALGRTAPPATGGEIYVYAEPDATNIYLAAATAAGTADVLGAVNHSVIK